MQLILATKYHDGGVRDDCTAPMHSGVGAAGLPESWFYPLGTICCVGFETLDQCEVRYLTLVKSFSSLPDSDQDTVEQLRSSAEPVHQGRVVR